MTKSNHLISRKGLCRFNPKKFFEKAFGTDDASNVIDNVIDDAKLSPNGRRKDA